MKSILQSKFKKLKRGSARRGWVKACIKMAKNGNDKLKIPDVFKDEKF
ncbi:MAG: hypothetical protein ABIO81_00190 [Ginsengibacter sp.]